MDFIIENYLIFVIIGAFIIFALIGYIIDTIRKNNNENNSINIPTEVNIIGQENTPIEQNNVNNNTNPQIESVNITNINQNNADDLLNSYNDTNNS